MKRVLSIIFLLTLLNLHSAKAQSQSEKTDSLEIKLQLVEANERIPILIQLMELTDRDQPDKALSYAAEAEEMLAVYPEPVHESRIQTQIGWIHYYKHEYDIAMEHARQSEQLAQTISHAENTARAKLLAGRLLREMDDYEASIAALDSSLVFTESTDTPLLRGTILNEVATVYRRKGEPTRALGYHNQALELIEPTGDKSALAVTYNYLGIIHDVIGNYDEALRYHLQSMETKKEIGDRRGMAASMTNMGILHQRLEQFTEALDFYEQSLGIWQEMDLKGPMAATLNNIGAVHELMGNYETALNYYEDAHTIWSEQGNLYSISISLNNIGTIYEYLGDYDRALNYKHQALKNHKELGNKQGSANVVNDIAMIHMQIEQPDSALAAARQSLDLALETEIWSAIRNAHELLSEIYEQTGDYEESLEHYKLFKAADDTLFNADSQSAIAELQEQYRTRQQQQEIELLQQGRELQKLWLLLIIGGFTTAFIVTGFFYNRYKLKVKNREKLHLAEIEKSHLAAENAEAKAKLLDAENRRKSKELEDARKLQLSMLPAELPECSNALIAAYMKTAAEVGGDYYDVDLQDDGTLTFCIGDATGHGTKAGLLVMAMKSLFNLTSREENLTEIMRRCSAAIKRMNLSQLYMAFAVARLKGDTLELVGGGMPPALVYRCATGEVESIDLKGMPLGSVPDYPYTLTTLPFCKNDILLLLSDGYPELMNDKGEMMGYEKPAEILANAGCLSIEEILDRFRDLAEEWTECLNPNDDVTFVVVKRNGDG